MTAELDPNSIVIGDRQRKKIENIDDNFVKSVTERLIHPIVLRREEDEIKLVVGGRRLAALKAGNVNPLRENIHFRYFDDLNSDEAKIIELEENAKREDLPWRDHVSAIGELDRIFRSQNPKWDSKATAERLNLHRMTVNDILRVYKNLSNPVIRDATSIKNAISFLQISSERAAAQFVGQITDISREMFPSPHSPINWPSPPSPAPSPNGNPNPPNLVDGDGSVDIDLDSPAPPSPSPDSPPPTPDNNILPPIQRFVLNADFADWITAYDGPKFNLIHCDFPFDIRYDSYAKSVTSSQEDYDFTGFWPLCDILVDNINKVCSYSAHIMFWFSMKFYQQTKDKLEKISDLYVHEHPFVWLKSDNSGIIPGRDNQFPRRIYETAFLCTRNKRPLVKSISNAYAAPTAPNPIHPSVKPEPVLRFFFSGLVDETTDLFDPTAGSASALRAADSLNARTIIGLEKNQTYADAAEGLCQTHRKLKNLRI